MNIATQIEPTIPDTNPLDFMMVTTNLSLTEHLKERYIPNSLKINCIRHDTDLHYPEKDWVSIYTDGSKADDANTTGAEVLCKFFSQV
jgi:hypothetical protein